MEELMVLSGHSPDIPTSIPRIAREEYSGSNLGDSIAWVSLDAWDASWNVEWALKKKMLGSRREDVGGKTDGLLEKGETAKPRAPDEQVPDNWFGMPIKLHECLIKENMLDASIDWEAGDMINALAHLRMKKQYTGMCWTEGHREEGYKWLEIKCFEDMLDEEQHNTYDAGLAAILSKTTPKKSKPAPKNAAAKDDEPPSTEKKDPKKRPKKGDQGGEGGAAKEGQDSKRLKKDKTGAPDLSSTKSELTEMLAGLQKKAKKDGMQIETLDDEEDDDDDEASE